MKNSQLRKLFKNATAGRQVVDDDWMPPNKLRPLLNDYSEEIWLDSHRDLHPFRPDPPPPFSHLTFLGKKVGELRREWLRRQTEAGRFCRKKAGEAIRVCRKSYHVRYANRLKQTLCLIWEDRVDLIERPALWWAPSQVYGSPALLARTTWLARHFPELFTQLKSSTEGDVPDAYVLLDFRFGRWDDDPEKKGVSERQALRALASGRVGKVEMAAASAGGIAHLPGYGPEKKVTIEVLAPVPETIDDKPHFRWLGDPGRTKNGHSVVLRMVYDKVSLLLGGDLNTEAENYLLEHYRKISETLPRSGEVACDTGPEDVSRAVFEADIAKACHHGSADFTIDFLRAVNAAATVVSSGDQEPHCHPRPEALGAFGRYGRGDRPLIYSTELARSTEDKIKHPALLLRQLDEARAEKREREFIDNLLVKIGRSVAVYGMIAVRTDGKKVLIAQKLERPRSQGQKWDLHVLKPNACGKLVFAPGQVC